MESSHNPVVDTNKTQEDGLVHANGLSKVKLMSPSLGSIYAFIDHISNNFNNDKLKITQRINKEITPTIDVVYISLKEGIKQITYMADLKSLNFKDAEVDVVDVWPKELTDTYPEFKTLKPFNYYNYRFTEGCIFKCAFCYHSITDWLIKDEVTAVVDRLERWYDSGIEYMRFFNDNINFKLSWTTEFANEIVKRNIKIKWTDSANLKVGDRDMFMAMGESGCVKLWYGTETYSSRILKEIDKWTDQMYEKIDNTLVWAHEAGIWNAANLIVNFPHETDEEYDELRHFIGDYYNEGTVHQMNVQPLAIWEPSVMSAYPEKFRIRLDKNRAMHWHESHWGARWSEINDDGTVCTSPEEIQKRGDYRYENAFNFTDIPQNGLTTGDICWIFENEYLFFSLIQLYGTDKAKKKEVYHHILDKLSTNNEYHDICQKLVF